ncbi:MAG: phosphoribosyltransferase [Hyphomicrobium sp.]|nr:MAG: phosphoribosyltransferase [Hyphomicrobium sp.]PPD00464.1 MAG: phosphoribosyltransferase [Hyphomicrobium sp.]
MALITQSSKLPADAETWDNSPEQTSATGQGRQKLRNAARRLIDTILPPLCLGCECRILSHDALCPTCWPKIDFIRAPLCDRLGLPLPYSSGSYGTDGPIISAAAAADPPRYDRARAVAKFDGLMRDLVHDMKYQDSHNGRRLFGRWLADAGRELLTDADALVPIPLARFRLLSRRFNQAQILASEVQRLTAIPVRHFALLRTRSTARQVGMSRGQRQRNVAGAFVVPERALGEVAGKKIILIDDVITTGATVSAAAQAMKKVGAARVDVLALALVC